MPNSFIWETFPNNTVIFFSSGSLTRTRTDEEELRILVLGCPAMMKEEEVNIAIAFPIFGTGMRMKKSFPIFGNRNEEIMPNFWQQEYKAGIPGNG